MDDVLSIDGLNFNIYKHLIFDDLLSLRLCNKDTLQNISFFSETIFNTLKDRYLNTFDGNYNISISLSHIELYCYYTEMRFINIFLSNKQLYNTFVDTIKNIKIDNFKTKLYVDANNYYELMIYYKKDFAKRRHKIEDEESFIWKKNKLGKWIENGLKKYETIKPLMQRPIIILDYYNIF